MMSLDFESWKLLQHRSDFEVLEDPLSPLEELGIKRPRKRWNRLPDIKVIDGIFEAFEKDIYRAPEIARRLGVTVQTITRHREIVKRIMIHLNMANANKERTVDFTKGIFPPSTCPRPPTIFSWNVRRLSENSLVKTAEKVFDALPVHSSVGISELSEKAGISWATAKKWLELIDYIQNQDELQILKVTRGNLEYSRKGKKGRPSKS
uniref:Uncharacterized protein n=1 Tax=viral metagenome TaxID=1070528 RepID=A0A6M3MBK3_9ZZZZ